MLTQRRCSARPAVPRQTAAFRSTQRPPQGSIKATDEIGLMSGVPGQFFRPFGITISAAMPISLLVSRTLSPVLAVYWLEARAPRKESALEPTRNRWPWPRSSMPSCASHPRWRPRSPSSACCPWPLALGFGAGSKLRIPMAIAIMGGLLTSTVLSLVLVPVV